MVRQLNKLPVLHLQVGLTTGVIIATYFHYSDIRRLWPHRLREVRFVTIEPDPTLVDRLPWGVRRVILCERDEVTDENVAADLSVLLGLRGYRIEPVVSPDPESEIAGSDKNTVVLVAPRLWVSRSEASRSNPCVLAADYVINDGELNALARDLSWVAAAPTELS